MLLAALAIAGCSAQTNTSSIVIAGSTALLPLVKQAAVDYQNARPDVKISVAGGGSRVGITQVTQRAVDIGDSDIAAPDQPSLVDHQVAVVTFGIVVNPQTGVKNLTSAQIRAIFSGKMTNWRQAGGRDAAITIINRPRSSGTRAVLVQKVLGGREPSESGMTQDSSGTVATMVAQTPGAISYVGTAYVTPGRQIAVSIDGVAPTDANVESNKYPYWSYEHMFTNGQPGAKVAGFIDYVKNDRALLRRLKFIPVGDVSS
ncbi:MAG TPA: phosphate ABC transporter substrate-binding protein [Candidatus Rubrimentiphilum sp.]|nr:phosphate ABC transporter substrate-binding protein [Candidatus Rubrimentiphilum sp.]